MDKYYVITGCGNPNCNNRSYQYVIDALTYKAAQSISSSLRNGSSDICPLCGRKIGYYALQGERKEIKKSITKW